ncbi:MAG TPA: MFS transporter [Gemmatimonadaceae bacterium]|nr:MFS transporter [Gemmatimonadaceae bacterium]
MDLLDTWKSLDRTQRNAFTASFLGWMLDAFDFFLMVFVLRAIAAEFGTDVKSVALGVTLTLAMRPLGALAFGLLAERYGRRPVLMVDILLFSVLELASAFAPSLVALLVLRAAFGFAMGGEWGIGAALTMETLPARARGLASGILQQGYSFGYLAAAVVYGLLFDTIGWRGMFAVGVLPALLVLFIRRHVEESPAWQRARHRPRRSIGAVLRSRAGLFVYVVVLMAAFNFFSHGTQDLYPTFLQAQEKLSTHQVSLITIIASVGAIVGGTTVGALSQRFGRRRAIIGAALLALPLIPLWAFSTSVVFLALGAFLMQVSVQGAWGVIPVHLNELSPDEVRGTFPGFAYQLGNLLAAVNATWQAGLAQSHGGDYALALAIVAAAAAVAIALFTAAGPEMHGASFGGSEGGGGALVE